MSLMIKTFDHVKSYFNRKCLHLSSFRQQMLDSLSDLSITIDNPTDRTDLMNQVLTNGSVSQLIIVGAGHRILDGFVIPSSVTTFRYHPSLATPQIPSSVTTLEFDNGFKGPILAGTIPSTVTTLVFGQDFNSPITSGSIPSTVTKIDFGNRFNQPLSPGDLPPHLLELGFGDDFQEPLGAGCLPATITHLKLGRQFNNPVDQGCLSSNLTTLSFGQHFTLELETGSLPPTLTHLSFHMDYDAPINPGTLPQGLVSLTMGKAYIVPGVLPQSLVYLNAWDLETIEAGSIPSTLTHMVIINVNLTPGILPESLVNLSLGCVNSVLKKGDIPSRVERLRMDTYNKPIFPGVLPDTLVSLDTGYSFNQPIQYSSLPNSIKRLVFGRKFNIPLIEGTLPSQLLHLGLGQDYCHPFNPAALPSTLESITIGAKCASMHYNHILSFTNNLWPKSPLDTEPTKILCQLLATLEATTNGAIHLGSQCNTLIKSENSHSSLFCRIRRISDTHALIISNVSSGIVALSDINVNILSKMLNRLSTNATTTNKPMTFTAGPVIFNASANPAPAMFKASSIFKYRHSSITQPLASLEYDSSVLIVELWQVTQYSRTCKLVF
eukprot:gene13291-15623_t